MILHVFIAIVAGWLQRHQQQAITFLLEENRVLKAQLGSRRLRLTDTERRRLAALAHPLGRTRLKGRCQLIDEPIQPPHDMAYSALNNGSSREVRPFLIPIDRLGAVMNTSAPPNPFRHHRFLAEIISHAVWLYFRFCLSYRPD